MKALSPTYAGSLGLFVRGRNVTRLAIVALFTCFFLAVFATSAIAQEATIVGTVTDPTGAAVPNASITITNLETGLARTLTTSASGEDLAAALPHGPHSG